MKSILLRSVSITAICVSLSGCVPLIVGGVATAGYLASQERGAKAAVMDTKIKTHIKDKLTNTDYRLLTDVEVTVLQGDVLLSGVVRSQAQKEQVAKIVQATPDVQTVYNELYADGIYPAKQYADDSYLAAQVRGRLLAAKDVYSINYMVNVTNGTVYIMGIAETQSEMERVVHIARTTNGAVRVVNFVRGYEGSAHIEPAEANPVE